MKWHVFMAHGVVILISINMDKAIAAVSKFVNGLIDKHSTNNVIREYMHKKFSSF